MARCSCHQGCAVQQQVLHTWPFTCNKQADQQKRCRRRMLLNVGARADSWLLCVLCGVFMICTAALAKIYALQRSTPSTPCRELLSAESYSLLCLAATATRLCQVRIVMLPYRRVGRLHTDSPRTVCDKGLVLAAGWQAHQSPLRAHAFTISRPVPSVGPVAPALHGETAVGVAAPFRGNRNLGTFLSGSRSVYRNTGSCFLQRATPCR